MEKREKKYTLLILMQNVECRMQNVECRMQNVELRIENFQLSIVNCQLSIGCQLDSEAEQSIYIGGGGGG